MQIEVMGYIERWWIGEFGIAQAMFLFLLSYAVVLGIRRMIPVDIFRGRVTIYFLAGLSLLFALSLISTTYPCDDCMVEPGCRAVTVGVPFPQRVEERDPDPPLIFDRCRLAHENSSVATTANFAIGLVGFPFLAGLFTLGWRRHRMSRRTADSKTNPAAPLLVALLALFLPACGYRMANRAVPSLPQTVRTIAVPIFRNETFRFKIEETLTRAVIREMLSRTSYRMQSGEVGSDAVMNGVVTSIYSSPIVFDPASGRTTEVLITVGLRVSVQDTATRQMLFEANDLVFREPYQISSDPTTYFGEDQAAVERLSRQVASSLVATLIGNF